MTEKKELEALLHNLSVAKDAFLKSNASGDFIKYLRKRRLDERNDPFYSVDNYGKSCYSVYMPLYSKYSNNPQVVAIFEEANNHSNSKPAEKKGLTEQEQRVKRFYDAIEKKKAAVNISPELAEKIIECAKTIRDYKFSDPFVADFYMGLDNDAKWFFTVSHMEMDKQKIHGCHIVNQNLADGEYDAELRPVANLLSSHARVKVLYNMGTKREYTPTDKTLSIQRQMQAIAKSGKDDLLKERTLRFFAELEPYQKHLFRATEMERYWWNDALMKLSDTDVPTYLHVTSTLSSNSEVGKERNQKALDVAEPLIAQGKLTAYDYSLKIPDTKAGELFSYVKEMQNESRSDKSQTVIDYFIKHCREYMEIDINKEAAVKIVSNAGNQTTGLDVFQFLRNNYMNTDRGSFDHVATHFKGTGQFPSGRDKKQLADIKTRIAAIMAEINRVQDAYTAEVLDPLSPRKNRFSDEAFSKKAIRQEIDDQSPQ